MVPEIFKGMEEADNSDGFDSCEEAKSEHAETEQKRSLKKCGNPFQDFNIDILDVKDENEALSIKIGRKMIVDYIERAADNDFDGWKKMASGGSKKHPITSWTPLKAGQNVEIKYTVPIPNSNLDDVVRYLQDPDLKSKYDETQLSYKVVRDMPLDNKLIHIELKTVWPLGPRDMLVQTGSVRYQDKYWSSSFSVEDESCPVSSEQVRVHVPYSIIYVKSNPEIHGYQLFVTSEINLGGSIPNSLVLTTSAKTGMQKWTKF